MCIYMCARQIKSANGGESVFVYAMRKSEIVHVWVTETTRKRVCCVLCVACCVLCDVRCALCVVCCVLRVVCVVCCMLCVACCVFRVLRLLHCAWQAKHYRVRCSHSLQPSA